MFYRIRQLQDRLIEAKIRHTPGVKIGDAVRFKGMPFIRLATSSEITIGSKCTFISDFYANVAGINHPCVLAVISPNSTIRIGNGSGFSGVTLVASSKIEIGDNFGGGVNVCVYDTDFHPIDYLLRREKF